MNDSAWAAGFVDGEGCISLTSHRTLVLRVSQKDLRPLRKLKEMFGGSIRPQKPTGCAQWYLSSAYAVAAIQQMLPFLILKREQADVALLWASQPWRQVGILRGKRRRLTQEEKDSDDIFIDRLSSLKRDYDVYYE